ncbi:MAG: universal stress protein [bacterium]|nr:universal stress protein [bacterium]MYD04068.1 universal stress protein [Acidimicrobiia bacterium]MCY3580193.1 universal stress protein [bacterium]MCY3651464.1 universal stress protein [bacterium]MDE0643070.1 universal stress protein [bacterium]
MNQILAAVDLSPMSRRVAERARILAEAHQAELKLLHVAEPPDIPLSDEMLERVYLYRQSQSEDLLTWINSRAVCPVDLEVVSGNMAAQLAKRARQAELVVTSTSSVDQTRVGPLTTRLARKLRTPVLSVRRLLRTPYRRVIAAVDLSEASASAIDLALFLATGADTVTAVVSLPTDDEIMLSDAGVVPERLDVLRRERLGLLEERMQKFVSGWGGLVTPVVLDGPPPETVAEFARLSNADLVVAASRGAGASNLVLLGRNAERMMWTVPCDVAIARVPGRFYRP